MNSKDIAVFSSIMAALSENFRDNLSENGLSMRFEALKPYGIDQVKLAALKLLRERKYTKMPTVADFVEIIEGRSSDKSEEQAKEVLKQIRSLGSHRRPAFNDPITKDLFSHRFSWCRVCAMSESEIEWFLKSFKEDYLTYERIENTKKIEIPHEAADLKLIIGGIGKRF